MAKAIAIGLIVLGVMGMLGTAYWHIRQQGADAALQKIERANSDARDKAAAAAKSVDECSTAGGDWDRARGVCVRPGK